jgi:S-methyl-5-thioribose-1-phosphate isomerase
MKVAGKDYLTVRFDEGVVYLIDQNRLPFAFAIRECKQCEDTCAAIRDMTVRGAGAIGAAAGFALAQAFVADDDPVAAAERIRATRPTARDLFYAVECVFSAGQVSVQAAVDEAQRLARANTEAARGIGIFGEPLISDGARVLTHCNAGWLGFVDYGSALSPVYMAHRGGKQVFVYADETRPRSQGARLTAWELANEGIEHTIVPDNAGAYLMSKGLIDLVIVGADRIAANGDTANKIGTFEKAILARHFGIPFFVAAPRSTFDPETPTGADIIIEERSADEVHYQTGPDQDGRIQTIRVTNPGSDAFNPAFDVTPAEFITGIITEKGIIKPDNHAIAAVLR